MLYYFDEDFQWTNILKKLPAARLTIPGLHMIGHANFHSSFSKLQTHGHYTMEFTVILKGRQQFFVKDQCHTIFGGDIFMTTPHEPHGNQGLTQEVCEYIWFQFDLSAPPEEFLGLRPPHSIFLHQQLLNYRQRIKRAGQADLSALRRSFYLLASDSQQEQLLGHNLFLQFVISNLCPTEAPPETDTGSPDIQEAAAYIHAHLLEDLSIDTIARQINLSPARFKVKFKEQMGITPHAYILSLKIDTAKNLLKNPEASITQIAHMLNFSSSNHFSAVFKKYAGCTPSHYKNQGI